MSSTDIDAHLERIEEHGYSIIEDAIEPDVVDALVEDLERIERERQLRPARNTFEGTNTIRVYNLLAAGALYEQIPVHPRVLPLAERVLDPGLLVSSLSSIAILPGEVAQPIHADDQLIPLRRPHIPIVCNTMWALTDFTEDNGATRVIPGSHKWPKIPKYGKPYDSVPAQMRRGSVLVYNGSLWHGGGANHTDQRRIGVAMNYCAGFIRQQENQQLGVPRDIARGFSPRLRELVGYSIYHGIIGHIDRKHPSLVLG